MLAFTAKLYYQGLHTELNILKLVSWRLVFFCFRMLEEEHHYLNWSRAGCTSRFQRARCDQRLPFDRPSVSAYSGTEARRRSRKATDECKAASDAQRLMM